MSLYRGSWPPQVSPKKPQKYADFCRVITQMDFFAANSGSPTTEIVRIQA